MINTSDILPGDLYTRRAISFAEPAIVLLVLGVESKTNVLEGTTFFAFTFLDEKMNIRVLKWLRGDVAWEKLNQ